MARIVLFGNSGSGKSTLALRLARDTGLPHLDLDVIAWTGIEPPERRPAADSARDIEAFMAGRDGWVIEGCYADLVAVAARGATRLVFLNPGVEACRANARARPWEPHKYPTKEKQDAGLAFLLGWIGEYETREDVYSLKAHRAVFDAFAGDRVELASREAIAEYGVAASLPPNLSGELEVTARQPR